MSISVILIYAIAALILAIYFTGMAKHAPAKSDLELPGVSIIICARNEETHLEACLQSVLKQHYPRERLEVLVVDDASTDQTRAIALKVLQESGIAYRVLVNDTQKGKKESIRKAVDVASNEWIVMRDADTYTLSQLWLQHLMDFAILHKKSFIIAPVHVHVHGNASFTSFLQSAESMILMMLTAVSAQMKKPFLCSGANLAFTKTLFHKTGAFQKHLNVASGDDVLFLEDVKATELQAIGYLHAREAAVYSYALNSFMALVKQRIRWAGKVFVNKNRLNLFLAAFIFLVNLLFINSLLNVIVACNEIFNALIFIGIKLIIDILLVFLASRFLKERFRVMDYLAAACLYPLYAIIVAVGSFLYKPDWK
jgi:poly-beta-1,6-N-acetyl-D-glucosamine synthase